MEQIQFASGIQEYRINGKGILRFHPGDPNLYARFLQAGEKIQQQMEQLSLKAHSTQQDSLVLMAEADRGMKEVLNWAFGAHNDFDQILGGISLLAVADNGKYLVSNLLEALEPVMTEGAKKCARQQAQMAVHKAEVRKNNND